MRRDIPPPVQFGQVFQSQWIPRVGRWQIQPKPEALEVFPQIMQVGVAVVEGAMGRELGLDQDSKRSAHPEGDDLGGFGVKVAAEPLEVGAKKDDAPEQILFAESRVGRSQRLRCGALRFNLVQPWHALVHPML
jgi:hypothetical protein